MTPGLAGGLRDLPSVLRDPAPRLRAFAESGLPRFPGDPGHRPDHDNAGSPVDAVAASRSDAVPMPPSPAQGV